MATYEIKKEGNLVKVKVSVQGLPSSVREARKIKEVVYASNVKSYLKSQGIEVFSCAQGGAVSNFSGAAATGEFIFLLREPPSVVPVLEDALPVKNVLTREVEPAIIKENVKTPNKRKRSKYDSPGKRTTETSE